MTIETNREDLIRARAYLLWEEGGRRHGDHEQHWHQAAREFIGEALATQRVASRKAATAKAPVKNAAPAKKPAPAKKAAA